MSNPIIDYSNIRTRVERNSGEAFHPSDIDPSEFCNEEKIMIDYSGVREMIKNSFQVVSK